MLEAVLFDWGDTLMSFHWDDELVEAGHRAGLEALRREDLPTVDDVAAHFRVRYLPLFWVSGTLDEIEYPGLVRELLGHFRVEVSDEDLDRFLVAEHAAWDPARQLSATTHALLESLRAQGLKLAVVSNAFDPGWLLQRDLIQMGIAARVDFSIFSSEIGKRKPHPAIFEAALEALGVRPERALFVGDRLYEDIRGAGEMGMRTVQALWHRADENEAGREPDFQAYTQYDVLNIVRRLNGET